MGSLLLIIIYIAFISLGLPDSILGSAWPSMYPELDVPISYAGILSMIIAAGTIFSSIFAAKLIQKWGTGLITLCSVSLTAIALTGFGTASSFTQLILWAIPYGLGAGSVDAGLNNFAAIHYQVRHLNWLHCFWGVGATLGPCIMGTLLTRGMNWQSGYLVIAIIQVLLSLVLLLSLPLWKKAVHSSSNLPSDPKSSPSCSTKNSLSLCNSFRLKGTWQVMIIFFCYCTIESTTGLWAGSYLAIHRGIDPQTAAQWVAIFYLGITLGRFFCGWATFWFSNQRLIQSGLILICAGSTLLTFSGGSSFWLGGLILIGLGCAPIFPGMLHQTPERFGTDHSQSIMGIQMASGYMGTTLMPPFFGNLKKKMSLSLLPYYLLINLLLMAVIIWMLGTPTKVSKSDSTN